MKNFATVKQWKDPMEAVRSNMNMEKLIGLPQDQLLRLPKADADAAEWGKVFDRLGRPKTAEEYKLPTIEGDDGSYAKEVQNWMHEAGLTPKQAQSLAAAQNKYVKSMQTGQQESSRVQVQAELDTLKKEQGAAFDKFIQVAQGAAREFGISKDTIDSLEKAMGFAGVMRFMNALGAKIGDPKFVSGDGNSGFNGTMAPAQAQAQLSALKGDPGFVTKYLNGDVEARARMENLTKMAFPDG